ncbi:MAG: hypothetical protein KDD78_03845 [Caldilineaceae bacterium]|nr:hypothetical protein [Caldilineaceae bacterium]
MVKVLISYDMLEGKEQECQEYLVNKMAPALANLGFNVADVWYTVWGNSPQILSGGEVASLDEARRIFQSKEWNTVVDDLTEITHNFKLRLVQGSAT